MATNETQSASSGVRIARVVFIIVGISVLAIGGYAISRRKGKMPKVLEVMEEVVQKKEDDRISLTVKGFSFCKAIEEGGGGQDCWQHLADSQVEGEQAAVIMRNGGVPYAVLELADGKTFQLGSMRILTDVGIGNEQQWLKDFRIAVSQDGENFQEVLQAQKSQESGFEDFDLGGETEARLIKISFETNYGDTVWTQVGEIEVYGSESAGSAE